MSGTIADNVIDYTKSFFARHRNPEFVALTESYKQFTSEYQFTLITSSSFYPQSNGEAERTVGTVKSLLRKEGDPYLALLRSLL